MKREEATTESANPTTHKTDSLKGQSEGFEDEGSCEKQTNTERIV